MVENPISGPGGYLPSGSRVVHSFTMKENSPSYCDTGYIRRYDNHICSIPRQRIFLFLPSKIYLLRNLALCLIEVIKEFSTLLN